MSEFFASGYAVDIALALIVAEALLLITYRRRTGAGPVLRQVAGNLMSGVFLMLALRAALTHASWRWIAAYLMAALIAHIIDVWQRWSS